MNYAKIFSLVAKISSIRILTTFVANLGWPLFQLDFKNEFLNGDLQKEVYMEQPPKFVVQRGVWESYIKLSMVLNNLPSLVW